MLKIIQTNSKIYFITQNGEAYLLYNLKNGLMDIYETYVPETERGKGVALLLVKEAFKYAIKNNLKIKPSCSYVYEYIQKNKNNKKLMQMVDPNYEDYTTQNSCNL